jgi:phosphoribosyl-ATP pyrophosphohydrolase/phosphoribosyl-AMP cyclohydrolase
MIIPSIDIQNGRAVQLVGGRELALEAGDPLTVAERFGVAGELAVIDLDAALGRGDNREVIRRLVSRYPCRVGGGIRSAESALDWLDAGAEAVILGTAAVPEILGRLPRERVMAALDAVDGEVVVDGWRSPTGARVEQRLDELEDLVGGFLLTFVEREGRMEGTDLERARALIDAAAPARVTVAGGIRSPEEVAALDRLGADAQVGMALYTGELELGQALAAPLVSDRPDGLWPTVVCDESGSALGLAYSSLESLRQAVATRRGVYQSRSRGLWEKGAGSGNRQELLRVEPDCDRDALRFVVRQHGEGFCHRGDWSCWSSQVGLGFLERHLAAQLAQGDPQSYTRRLLENAGLLAAKLVEEAEELAAATGTEQVAWEAADLLYFAMVALHRAGVPLAAAVNELERRSRRVRRSASRTAGEVS